MVHKQQKAVKKRKTRSFDLTTVEVDAFLYDGIINSSMNGGCRLMSSSHLKPSFFSDVKKFHDEITSPLFYICNVCGERAHTMVVVDADKDVFRLVHGEYESPQFAVPVVGDEQVNVCRICYKFLQVDKIPRFSIVNGNDIGEVPEVLGRLNFMEVRLISIAIPMVTVYHLCNGGQQAARGNGISYWNDVPSIVTKLPRALDDSGIVNMRRPQNNGGSRFFDIRPAFVREALYWLKVNNPLYHNVDIDEEALCEFNSVDVEESISVPSCIDMDSNDILGVDGITESFEHQFNISDDGISQHEQLQALLSTHYPQFEAPILREPVDEYTCEHLFQLAFPDLYPYGRGGFVPLPNERRTCEYSLADYVAHLMQYHDRRFVKHRYFKFFALSLTQRRQIDSLVYRSAEISERITHSSIDIKNLLQIPSFENLDVIGKHLLDQLTPYFKPVRGSSLYWKNVRGDLRAMIGSDTGLKSKWPTFFLTLSAADTMWPDFVNAIDPTATLAQIREMSSSDRNQLLNDYPDIAASHFYRRFQSFFKNILHGKYKPLGRILHHFYRFEWQKRGSPHVHCLLWTDSTVNFVRDSQNTIGRDRIREFLDAHVYTICPEESLLKENYKSLQIYPPLDSSFEYTWRVDLANLVADTQMHGPCDSGPSEKWRCRQKTGKCRFKYPKKLREETCIEFCSSNGVPRVTLLLERNNAWVNNYNPALLQAWRANIDLQPVGNVVGVAEYVASYCSKSEPDSLRFKNAIRNACKTMDASCPLRQKLKKIACTITSVREVSAQEALHILMRNMDMYSFSVTIVPAKVSRHHKRSYQIPRRLPSEGPIVQQRMERIELAYMLRPSNLQHMSYESFVSEYVICDVNSMQGHLQRIQLSNGEVIRKRRAPAIVKPSPFYPCDPLNADYCYAQLFLKQCWRALSDLPCAMDDVAIIAAFERLSNDMSDLGGALARKIHRYDAIASLNLAKTLHTNSSQTEDTATLSESQCENIDEMICVSSPSDTPQHIHMGCLSVYTHTDEDYESANSFISSAISTYLRSKSGNSDIRPCIENYQYPIDGSDEVMNCDQWMAFALFMRQSRLRKENTYVPIQCIINGVAGAGKSWLVKHIIRDIKLVNNEKDGNMFSSSRVLLCAHQGIAAFNIKGRTICDAFRLDVKLFSSAYQPLNGDDSRKLKVLSKLQSELCEIQLVVIDEHSMISAEMLHHLDMRMREIYYRYSTLPFGGRDMIFMGDFKQLPPVLSCSLARPRYDTSRKKSADEGHQLWQDIKYVFTLKKNQRAASDDSWAKLLQRIREGTCDESHVQQLAISFVKDPYPLFADPTWRHAKVVCKTNARVRYYNELLIKKQPKAIITIIAKHHISSKSMDLTEMEKESLIQSEVNENILRGSTFARLDIAIGSPVRITKNLCTAAGLCNGTPGRVIDIWYNSNEQRPSGSVPIADAVRLIHNLSLPIVLIQVERSFYDGPSFLKDIPGVVPIVAVSSSYRIRGGINISRTMLPLQINYAMTIYKVQGLTIDRLIFDTEKIRHGTEVYVALSRVRNKEDVVICGSHLTLKQVNEFWAPRDVLELELGRLSQLERELKSSICFRNMLIAMNRIARLHNRQVRSNIL